MFKVLFALSFLTFAQAHAGKAAKIHSADNKSKCELSCAEIVEISNTQYLVSSNNKDKDVNTFSFYNLIALNGNTLDSIKRFFGMAPPFMPAIKPAFVLKNTAIPFAKKIESLATVDDWVIVVGSFTYFKGVPTNTKMGAFKIGDDKSIISPHIVASEAFIEDIFDVLAAHTQNNQRPTYVKIEAATVVPTNSGANKLLLGLRTMNDGASTPKRDVIKILGVNITATQDKVTIGNDLKLIASLSDNDGQGISGLSYDANTQTAQMITSYENGKTGELDGTLWQINAKDLLAGKNNFQKLERVSFKGHKPEGVKILNGKNSHLTMVIFDDDRNTPKMLNGKERNKNESPFYVIDTR